MSYRKGPRGRADRRWAEYIRALGYCERCGDSTGPFEAAHIIRRRYQGTRCDPDNGWCLCKPCHGEVDSWNVEHLDLVRKTITVDGYERLEAKAKAAHGQRLSDGWWADVADELARLLAERETT